ncbi:uncharacterized protein Dwil_GK19101 [Drosophila willistoni]|uniref:Uncharacterized protein n=1 Tax=Drosophila willistoni TaxID=7260 RepID=B4MRS7_DROWI|nr:uncharacterized protein LOC6640848 [Drosophila willistoni]EDW74816.1 uncharacterized protein Dwil_GK19101 [Drosophila willistoni]
MATSSLLPIDLISNKYRVDPVVVPNIQRIDNIREFLEDSNIFNGDINPLVERLDSEYKQCYSIVQLLKEEVIEQNVLLDQVKKSMLELQDQVKMSDAGQRFLVDREKILVQFSDETEITECNVPTALELYSLKMGKLYVKILSLDTDIDFVTYLRNVSLINRDYVKNWYNKAEGQNENVNTLKNNSENST